MTAEPASRRFLKMNGAGNDFVIFDVRKAESAPLWTAAQVRQVADRGNGVTHGCDQLIVIEKSAKADAFMRIYNADGGEVKACGNATRCVAGLLQAELGRAEVTIETLAGILRGRLQGGQAIVDMGAPGFDAASIPLGLTPAETAERMDREFQMKRPVFVSMGNPHVVFFDVFVPLPADSAAKAPFAGRDWKKIGAELAIDSELFPQGVNVSFASLYRHPTDEATRVVKARVWERGAGATKACGTAACAILAAANRRDKTIDRLSVQFGETGLALSVERDVDGHIWLGGPVVREFEGSVTL